MLRIRPAALTVAAVLAGAAAPASARSTDECADYVSTSIDDAPDAGELIGTQEVTESWGYGNHVAIRSRTRQIGLYRMSNGAVVELDCETYEVFGDEAGPPAL